MGYCSLSIAGGGRGWAEVMLMLFSVIYVNPFRKNLHLTKRQSD
jgi:hypothetical protein